MTFSKWMMLFLGLLYLTCSSECSRLSILEDIAKEFLSRNCSEPKYPERQCGNYEVEVLLTTPTTVLSTSPFWNARDRSVYYTDTAGTLNRFSVDTGKTISSVLTNVGIFEGKYGLPVGPGVGSILPTNKPDQFVVTYGTGIGLLCWNGRDLITLYEELYQFDPIRQFPTHVIYDAEVGPKGSVFFNLLNIPFEDLLPIVPFQGLIPGSTSTLCGICNNKLKALFTTKSSVSGIAFSPAFDKIFFTDSVGQLIYSACFDPTDCSISNIKVLINYAKECIHGAPDGIATDSEGYLWAVVINGGQVLKIHPTTGKVLCAIRLCKKIETCVRTITAVAFGGCPGEKNGTKCMYLTSALFNSTRLDPEGPLLNPNSGKLIRVSNFGSQGGVQPPASVDNILKAKPKQ